MLDVFYKGADIDAEFELYEDEDMAVMGDIEAYDIDIAFYTVNSGDALLASTTSGKDVVITRVPPNRFALLIPASLTKRFTSGLLSIEIMLTSKITGKKSIAAEKTIQIEDNIIGK